MKGSASFKILIPLVILSIVTIVAANMELANLNLFLDFSCGIFGAALQTSYTNTLIMPIEEGEDT